MIASVLWRALVGEGLVVTDVVAVEIIARGTANDDCGPRRSLIRAVTAISSTSSPKRRPLGQPPGINPLLPKGSWIALWSTSPPKTLNREKPVIIRIIRVLGPLPAKRAGGVERSTLIMSGI